MHRLTIDITLEEVRALASATWRAATTSHDETPALMTLLSKVDPGSVTLVHIKYLVRRGTLSVTEGDVARASPVPGREDHALVRAQDQEGWPRRLWRRLRAVRGGVR